MNRCLACNKIIDNNKNYCDRCFNIKNYNIKDDSKNTTEEEILTFVGEKACVFVCDLLSINEHILNLYKNIKNNKIFVLSKSDIIKFDLDIIKRNLRNYYGIDPICFSIKSGTNKGLIQSFINHNKDIVFLGPTSSGKSSLINFLYDTSLITSKYKNTTITPIEVISNDVKLLDTPGFNREVVETKKLTMHTITLKEGYVLIINDEKLAFDRDVNLTLFLDSNIKFVTKKEKIECKYEIKNKDIVFPCGFVYVKNRCFVNKEFELRNPLCGGHYE